MKIAVVESGNNRSLRYIRKSRKVSRNISLSIFKVMFALTVICLFFSIKAIGSEKAYFSTATDSAETQYMSDVKTVLKTNGINNAGITMTKSSVDGHNIEYTVLIHTSQIYMDLLREIDITSQVNDVVMEVANSTTTVIFN